MDQFFVDKIRRYTKRTSRMAAELNNISFISQCNPAMSDAFRTHIREANESIKAACDEANKSLTVALVAAAREPLPLPLPDDLAERLAKIQEMSNPGIGLEN